MGTCMNEQERDARVRGEMNAFCLRVIEQYGIDSIQILASRVDANGTACIRHGFGNWYARTGMAQEFLEQERAMCNANEMREVLNEGRE